MTRIIVIGLTVAFCLSIDRTNADFNPFQLMKISCL